MVRARHSRAASLRNRAGLADGREVGIDRNRLAFWEALVVDIGALGERDGQARGHGDGDACRDETRRCAPTYLGEGAGEVVSGGIWPETPRFGHLNLQPLMVVVSRCSSHMAASFISASSLHFHLLHTPFEKPGFLILIFRGLWILLSQEPQVPQSLPRPLHPKR